MSSTASTIWSSPDVGVPLFVGPRQALIGRRPWNAQRSRTAPNRNRSNRRPKPTHNPPPTSVRQPTNSRPKTSPLLTKAVLPFRISCGTRILPSPEPWVIPSSHLHSPFPRPEAQSVYTRILNKAPPATRSSLSTPSRVPASNTAPQTDDLQHLAGIIRDGLESS